MLPRWVRSLDDYWSWFAEQLDYSGARLEDESVQVQVVEDEATGERLALILGRQRIVFHGGSWLEFRVVVDRSLEQVEDNYHYSSAQGELIWRMDKHPGHGEPSHIHRPGDRPTPTLRSTSPTFCRRSSSSWSEAPTGQRLPGQALFDRTDRCCCVTNSSACCVAPVAVLEEVEAVGDRSRLAAAGGGGATTATSVGISLLDNKIVFRSSPTPFGYA